MEWGEGGGAPHGGEGATAPPPPPVTARPARATVTFALPHPPPPPRMLIPLPPPLSVGIMVPPMAHLTPHALFRRIASLLVPEVRRFLRRSDLGSSTLCRAAHNLALLLCATPVGGSREEANPPPPRASLALAHVRDMCYGRFFPSASSTTSVVMPVAAAGEPSAAPQHHSPVRKNATGTVGEGAAVSSFAALVAAAAPWVPLYGVHVAATGGTSGVEVREDEMVVVGAGCDGVSIRAGSSGSLWALPQRIVTLVQRISVEHVRSLAEREPLVAAYLRSPVPYLTLHNSSTSAPPHSSFVGIVRILLHALRQSPKPSSPHGDSSAHDACSCHAWGGVGGGMSGCYAPIPPDAATVLLNAAALHSAPPVAASLASLHAASCSEAARRRLGALVNLAVVRALPALALELAAWLHPRSVALEGLVTLSDTTVDTAVTVAPPPPLAPTVLACAPLLDTWPFPFPVLDAAVVGAPLPSPRYRVTGSGNGGGLAMLQQFVVEGAAHTPLGQRLSHPDAVLSYAALRTW